MPIAKIINHPKRGELALHVIDSVDFLLVNGAPIWRGHYRSFENAEAFLAPESQHADSGRIVGVAIGELGNNPVAAFEQAAIDSERSPFFGGTLVTMEATVLNALEVHRAQQWEQIKYARDQALISGVNTPYGKFNTDTVSLVNMLGAVSVGEGQGPTWSSPWITFDNTNITVNVIQLRQIGMLAANWRAACYTQGAQLRATLEAALTKESIKSVVWTNPEV